MCGIVGMAGNINQQHKEIFKDMLTVCQLRGRHSTGAIRVGRDDKFTYVKRACLPSELFDLKTYDREIDSGLAKVLVGHCRHKTVGQINSRSAHPFEHGPICGVHNGTLNNCYNMEGWRDFDVDSDWLYWHIYRHGLENTIPKIDNSGAWALVWWDENEKTLNFLRNEKRPLWFTHSKDMKTMFWASEPWMFGTVERKIDLWEGDEKGRKFYQLETDAHYSFEINDNGSTPKDVFKMRPIVKVAGEVRGYKGNGNNNHGCAGVNRHTGVVADFRQNKASSNVQGNTGGEVASPFRRNDLNDDIRDVGNLKVKGLPLPSPVHTPPAGVSSRIGSNTNSSSSTSQVSGDSKTGSTSSGSSERKGTLSLLTTSKSSPQEGRGGTSNTSNGSTTSSRNRMLALMRGSVSFREVLGTEYITDNKTGKEYASHEFDKATDGKCCFCTQPIGDLKEVAEIFVKEQHGKFAEPIVTFLCRSCTIPHFNA